MVNQERFFRALGKRVRDLRKKQRYSQEDMISFGFSARHWQRVEAGRPITVTTLLWICDTLHVSIERLVRYLDKVTYHHKTSNHPSNQKKIEWGG
ncbi:MAG: helix-turn-helix domain-containing protein [Acidobacteriia bacterium]|nr:helix-turn-helix domain-containing protein [Terriglobia bacterium]